MPAGRTLPSCTRRWWNRPFTATTSSSPPSTLPPQAWRCSTRTSSSDRMNLYVMPLGAEGNNVSLGSLDFLGEGEAAVQFALSGEGMGVATRDAARVSGRGSKGVEEGVIATLPHLDLAIMNPPVHPFRGRQLAVWQSSSNGSVRSSRRSYRAALKRGRRPQPRDSAQPL